MAQLGGGRRRPIAMAAESANARYVDRRCARATRVLTGAGFTSLGTLRSGDRRGRFLDLGRWSASGEGRGEGGARGFHCAISGPRTGTTRSAERLTRSADRHNPLCRASHLCQTGTDPGGIPLGLLVGGCAGGSDCAMGRPRTGGGRFSRRICGWREGATAGIGADLRVKGGGAAVLGADLHGNGGAAAALGADLHGDGGGGGGWKRAAGDEASARVPGARWCSRCVAGLDVPVGLVEHAASRACPARAASARGLVFDR